MRHAKALTREMVEPIASRFWDRTEKSGVCWIWRGRMSSRGDYGNVKVGRLQLAAHRVAFVLAKGDIPAGGVICHACDTPACVNPDHLWLGTQRDNFRDCLSKGRASQRHPKKLTAEKVQQIRLRRAAGERPTDLAAEFGVNRHTVRKIVNGRLWRGV